jgi:hypothetical protein
MKKTGKKKTKVTASKKGERTGIRIDRRKQREKDKKERRKHKEEEINATERNEKT